MRLQIEDWLSTQHLDNDAMELLKESIICYKASAYRASFILSYLGFMTTLKNRMLNGDQPTVIDENKWKNKLDNLRDEDKWEKEVFNLLINGKDSVFLITDEIRLQVKYWKDRRNDCVHFKNELVDYALIESFWKFLKIYLPRFIINGSKLGLLNKISDHFTPSKTQPGSSYDFLIKEISTSVPKDELIVFLRDLEEVTNSFFFEFVDKILYLCDDSIIAEITKYLQSDNNKQQLLGLLRLFPNNINLLKNEKKYIRELWHDDLFCKWNDDFPILCSLIRNMIIPDSEVYEALEKALERNGNHTPEEKQLSELKKHNFFSLVRERYYNTEDYNFLNNNCNLIFQIILIDGLTTEDAIGINEALSLPKPPFALCRKINQLKENNPKLISKIIKTIESSGEELNFRLSKQINDW